MTQLESLTQTIFNHLEERGWHTPTPASLAKSVVIEAAELLENFQWSESSLEKIQNDPKKLSNIKLELADVLIYCLQMAKVLDLDVEKIIQEKLAKVAQKYPAEAVKGNDQEYWKLKAKARGEQI
jgi:NTP pyrophosphatase (non-canonical NTP hydrolase)